MISIKGFLGFVALFVVPVLSDCPNVKDSDISPCVCLTNQIRCEGKTVTDDILKSVLEKIDKSRPDHLKSFEGLELYNTNVTKITTEIFGKLILSTFIKLNGNPITSLSLGNFKDLEFLDASNNNLVNISSNTFLGLKSLRYLNLANNGIANFDKNTFSLSDNLQKLILTGNKIQKLNSDQFSSEYDNNIELLEIDLSFNELAALPDNIFWPLRRPTLINLAHNKLNGLEPNSLSFGEDLIQYDPIRLVLVANGLKDSDLTNQTFAKIAQQKLYIEVDLSDNTLTHLDEKVFRSLLETGKTVVTLNDNPIKCADCANKWLVSDTKIQQKSIILNKCADDSKRTIWQFSQTDFKNCQ